MAEISVYRIVFKTPDEGDIIVRDDGVTGGVLKVFVNAQFPEGGMTTYYWVFWRGDQAPSNLSVVQIRDDIIVRYGEKVLELTYG